MDPNPVEEGVYEIPLLLEPALEGHRLALHGSLLAAQRRLKQFTAKYGWQVHLNPPFAIQAHIFDAKPKFDRALLEISGLDPAMELPATYCAALEERVLLCVSPTLYGEVYPEGDEEQAFEKLLAHEMAHRLHIRILNGDEEAMGPVWFYEGFALVAASQFEHTSPRLTPDEIWAVVRAEERGDYRQYASVLHHFLNQASLPRLVEMAGRPEFGEWLLAGNPHNSLIQGSVR